MTKIMIASIALLVSGCTVHAHPHPPPPVVDAEDVPITQPDHAAIRGTLHEPECRAIPLDARRAIARRTCSNGER